MCRAALSALRMRGAVDRRHAPRTHGLHAGAQAARRVPTLPADDLVYTTCEVSVITRNRPNFKFVRSIGCADGRLRRGGGMKSAESGAASRAVGYGPPAAGPRRVSNARIGVLPGRHRARDDGGKEVRAAREQAEPHARISARDAGRRPRRRGTGCVQGCARASGLRAGRPRQRRAVGRAAVPRGIRPAAPMRRHARPAARRARRRAARGRSATRD